LNWIGEIGWDAVISLKQNSRDLYQSAVHLFAHRPPDVTLTEQQDHKTYQIQLWDTEGLPFTIDNPDPVRVVRSEEVLQRQRYRRGERSAHATDHEWLWITTLPSRNSLLRWFANSDTAVGKTRTMAGWTSPNTGPSSMDSCMLASTGQNKSMLRPDNGHRSPTMA